MSSLLIYINGERGNDEHFSCGMAGVPMNYSWHDEWADMTWYEERSRTLACHSDMEYICHLGSLKYKQSIPYYCFVWKGSSRENIININYMENAPTTVSYVYLKWQKQMK